jgi:Protein of unknown function (DUF3037)
MRYDFSVVRFVPDAVRGEFVNIGVIVGSDQTAEWTLRLTDNRKRAQKIDVDSRLGHALKYVEKMEREIEEYRDAIEDAQAPEMEISAAWLRLLASQSRNVVQLTEPAAVSAESIHDALEFVFDQFVLEAESQRAKFIPRSTAVARIADAYRQLNLTGDHVVRRPRVHGPKYADTFDFVVGNGRAVQLAQAFSFAVSGQESVIERVKSWSWTVKDIRENGGVASADGRNVAIGQDVEIKAVIVRPQTELSDDSFFDEAMEAFADTKVEPVTLNDVGDVALRAVMLLQGAH